MKTNGKTRKMNGGKKRSSHAWGGKGNLLLGNKTRKKVINIEIKGKLNKESWKR